jgi:hypothetical protein
MRYPDAQSARGDKRRPLLRTLLLANKWSYSVLFIMCMILDWMLALGALGLNWRILSTVVRSPGLTHYCNHSNLAFKSSVGSVSASLRPSSC